MIVVERLYFQSWKHQRDRQKNCAGGCRALCVFPNRVPRRSFGNGSENPSESNCSNPNPSGQRHLNPRCQDLGTNNEQHLEENKKSKGHWASLIAVCQATG